MPATAGTLTANGRERELLLLLEVADRRRAVRGVEARRAEHGPGRVAQAHAVLVAAGVDGAVELVPRAGVDVSVGADGCR